MIKIGVKSGLLIVIRRIKIHHKIGFIKSVRYPYCSVRVGGRFRLINGESYRK